MFIDKSIPSKQSMNFLVNKQARANSWTAATLTLPVLCLKKINKATPQVELHLVPPTVYI